ncbi:FG-GAP repeat protein [Actinomadura barringtoniae]|uniref:FG-GAP repeat protein n=1 Tax=Actinomadura barringtoniae TaxID=1427535 RepID=A0A939PGI6_9ACTN|nr:FG-GAP repeat protein [Actinomadura barringtoniae]
MAAAGLAASLILGLAVPASVLASASAAAAARAAGRPYDFNGDGYRDLAIGSPSATVAGRRGAGLVSVLYGSRKGLNGARKKVISQATAGVPGAPEAGDHFGSSLASADFDRDGYADLAIGAPEEDAGGKTNAGGVTILWGSRKGLGKGSAYGEARTAGALHRFGEELTVTDIQGDGSPELIVTVPGTSTFTWIYFNTRTTASKPGTASAAGRADVDRSWVAAGDINGDGRGDVVYGWYDYDGGEVSQRRGFTVFYGGANGRFSTGRTVYTTVHALAVGDFDGDRRADVAVGDTYDKPSVGGRVTVYRGSMFGLGGSYGIDQATPGVPGAGINEDLFGYSLAVGDVNRDGRADLAVGAPRVDIGRTFNVGRAYVLFGAPGGLTGRGAQAITENTKGVPGTAAAYENFGTQVGLLDHDGDGAADLTAGAPDEDRGNGGVTFVRGGKGGLTTRGAAVVGAGALGVRGKGAHLGNRLGH